jgi:hypothetical protein
LWPLWIGINCLDFMEMSLFLQCVLQFFLDCYLIFYFLRFLLCVYIFQDFRTFFFMLRILLSLKIGSFLLFLWWEKKTEKAICKWRNINAW